MAGTNLYPPYREPAGGHEWARLITSGPCKGSMKDSDEDGFTEREYSTKVPDYADPPGADIDPYPRQVVGDASCAPAPTCGTDPGDQPCGPWEKPYPTDSFTATGDTVDFSSCHKPWGHKIVRAFKAWHGSLGFLNDLGGGVCGGCSVNAAPSQKYLTRSSSASSSASFSLEFNDVGSSGTITASGSGDVARTYVVDKDSGLTTQTAFTNEGEQNNSADEGTYVVGSASTQIGEGWLDLGNLADLAQLTPSCGKVTLETGNLFLVAAGTYTAAELQAAMEAESFTGATSSQTVTATCTITETSFTVDATIVRFAREEDPGDPSLFIEENETINFEIDIQLSNQYTALSCYNDCATLLNEWPLNNDALYPWRTDGYETVGPYVTRDENSATGPDTWSDDPDWEDDSGVTGVIVGSPLSPGYKGKFDFAHKNYLTCLSATLGTYVQYLRSYGAKVGENLAGDVTDSLMPLNATQWVDQKMGAEAQPGAWVKGTFAGVSMQKVAYIKPVLNSINFFRPCGQDRFEIDQFLARCVSDASGDPIVVTLDATEAEPGTIATGDHCIYYDDEDLANSGVYEVTKLADYSYELTTLVRALPSGYTEAGPVFGPVRWPDAWAICGRASIASAVQDGSEVVITTSGTEAAYLAAGDSVDFSGVSGLSTGVTVNSVSGSEFRVTGTLSGAYTSGGYVKSTGAPDYQWHDDRPKGSYRVFQWELDNREIGENDRLIALGESCEGGPPAAIRANQYLWGMPREVSSFTVTRGALKRTPCAPAVVCVTPNGETFANGDVYAFPTVLPDAGYGAGWNALVVLMQIDPLYQAKRKSCSIWRELETFTFDWTQDNGTCQEDIPLTQGFYPQEAYREDDGLPAGAPDLPDGIYIDYLTLAELDTASEPDGLVIQPPFEVGFDQFTGTPNERIGPWTRLPSQCSCVSTSGRFADYYGTGGYVCP